MKERSQDMRERSQHTKGHSQDMSSLLMSQAITRWQNTTVPPFAPLTVLSLGAQAGRLALEGHRDLEKVGNNAHQRGLNSQKWWPGATSQRIADM